MILYHGTPLIETASKILEEGLKGGDNSVGGNRGTWKIPYLFLTPYVEVAKKYGIVLVINIDDTKLPIRIIDGLGDPCYVLEGAGILVNPEDINCPLLDHIDGICDNNCEFCQEEQ